MKDPKTYCTILTRVVFGVATTRAPLVEPRIMMNSDHCIRTRKFPPSRKNPPKTETKTTPMPIMTNMESSKTSGAAGRACHFVTPCYRLGPAGY